MTNYLGVDIGHKRIGLSIGSSELMFALPIRALLVGNHLDALQKLANVIKERCIEVVVFGYPFNMDDTISKMAQYVDLFINDFYQYIPSTVKVVKFDERLTSVQVKISRQRYYSKNFESRKKKQKSRLKGIIDSNAAALILQDYFNEIVLNLRKG